MKIGIVTVFKSLKCGSFLQAWALKEQLSSMGHDVYFVDYDNPWDTFAKRWEGVIKCCLRFRVKRAKDILDKTRDYKNLRRELNVIPKSDNSMGMYFFGSDTLWNFDDAYFNQYAPFFTGIDIQKPCYSYSISVGSTSEETFLKNEKALEGISKFKKIAVRDEQSENVISQIYPKENMVRTIDPTLLICADKYIKHFGTQKPIKQKNLVLYYFGSMPEATWRELKAFARDKELNIVFVGAHEEKYDTCVVSSPQNFISAFANAEYIFTNTFHGCVFSAIFNKSFATDGIRKKKIEGFLRQFDLLSRSIAKSEDLNSVYNTPIDYVHINKLIEHEKENSLNYIKDVIHSEGNHE